MVDPSPVSVVVAILTYRRPDDIAAVLPAVVEQLREVDEVVSRARVLVVDNDPGAGAREAVSAVGGPVQYVHEPEPGIAAARNRALDEARDDDVLVFIDDDERPDPGWLSALLRTWSSTRAAAVVGPVVSHFLVTPGPFVAAGRFFDRRRHLTGSTVDVAATNNLLLDLAVVRRIRLRFDPTTAATGGEDTLFTRALATRGGRMVWCDEAVVRDIVPPSRITPRWVLQRALSSGNSWSLTAVALAPSRAQRLSTRTVLHGRGLVRLVGGAGQSTVGLLTRQPYHRARGLRTAARGLGMLLGAWNVRYREYRRD
ncbi:glycosyltransferase family 2 protein [Amnibacterium setariae]|uniref:glycosyltransferase family 2 protein n=1 Tax=Amnibacterium setariae TaxID=2306585 RepID=UPI001F2542C3|nr:glycosyltransferase family 2 protein [Amnibacterium setariae]